jgi:hypothetical protein
MSWGVVNGTERMIPMGTNNEMKIEVGKPKKFRLLLQPGEEPFSFFEHTIENEKTESGQTTSVFRTLTCPKCKDNPYAPSKLCDGQQAKRRVRHVANVWDYELGQVKILKGGDSIWKPIGTLVSMGVDVTKLDFVATRTGTGRNDTEYSVVNLGPSMTPLPDGISLIDVRAEYTPATEEQMISTIQSAGLNWNAYIIPPAIQYPASLKDALAHVVPNTKYKGQSMGQIWENNKGMIDFFAKSNRVTPEKAAAQVILVALGGAQIDGVPNYANGNTPAPTTYQPAPTAQGAPAPASTPSAPAQTPSAPSADRQAKIQEINKLLTTQDKFKKGGYQVMMDTMKQASNGKTSINEFTDAELDKMVTLCKA